MWFMFVDRFLFQADVDKFFERSCFVLYVSCIYFIWQYDWKVYIELAPLMFRPVGLFTNLKIQFLPFYAVLLLQVFGTYCCAGVILLKSFRGFLSLGVFLTLGILDFYSNGFGFVNIQIHLIWFTLIFSVMLLSEKKDWIKSFCFRFIELIIVLAYVQSFIAKMSVTGLDWALDGTILQIGALRQSLPYATFIANSNSLSQFLSITAILLEASFLLYFFIPAKYKKILLSISIMFHISTFISMGIGFYHLWLMNLCIVLFAYKDDIHEQNNP